MSTDRGFMLHAHKDMRVDTETVVNYFVWRSRAWCLVLLFNNEIIKVLKNRSVILI